MRTNTRPERNRAEVRQGAEVRSERDRCGTAAAAVHPFGRTADEGEEDIRKRLGPSFEHRWRSALVAYHVMSGLLEQAEAGADAVAQA